MAASFSSLRAANGARKRSQSVGTEDERSHANHECSDESRDSVHSGSNAADHVSRRL